MYQQIIISFLSYLSQLFKTKHFYKMDLSQTKLTKAEWQSIETPVSDDEKKILVLIQGGYKDINIKYNEQSSLLSTMKMEYNIENEKFLYTKYFEKEIITLSHLCSSIILPIVKKSIKSPKQMDIIRLNHIDKNIGRLYNTTFEANQLKFCKDVLKDLKKTTTKQCFALYTLIQMRKSTILHLNQFVVSFVENVISIIIKEKKKELIDYTFHHLYDIVEKNPYLLQYRDKCLYEHQKHIFHLFQQKENEKALVLYTSATGSGKTITPLGLSVGNRIIYICAARHIGLQLAKSAISIGKCVAFAFGCESMDDIRLHYFSAVEFTRNKKSGSIAKVDNSDGSKVEIIICDISSYLISMYYMLLFNRENDIIMYWDEPTISLDQHTHPLHKIIAKNWQENKISKVVLSCATLPKQNEIIETLNDFREKFDGATIHEISSFECNKSVSLLNSKGRIVLPHLLFSQYNDLQKCVEHCLNNKSLLRYFDLKEVIQLIQTINDEYVTDAYKIINYFTDLTQLTMNDVKLYYLKLLQYINSNQWDAIYINIKKYQDEEEKLLKNKIGIRFTTNDAHTLIIK